ncbi:hypothetical protein B0A52_03495 [Exophiala mesophila]|uniref:Uncharacterized protein n=1 Tax=Exophiala mesophila TaxID=212818 RepID=A0A438N5T9_EXOME|nr:hypothetical protein B0A52_03495 [Exophiala mesophila]
MPEIDLVVVGAGQTGLVAAYTWLTLNPDSHVILLESDSCVGGVWSRNRVYPTMMTQTPVGMLEFSFLPLPKPRDTYYGLFSGEHVTAYLENFAQTTYFGGTSLQSRIHFDSPVTSISQEQQVWSVTTSHGSQYKCRKLIMATGPTSLPNKPAFFDESCSIPLLHSRDLQKNHPFLSSSTVHQVAVVGGSKSAFDTVYYLIKSGKQVHWLIRPDGQGPGLLATPDGGGLYQNSHEIISTKFIAKMSPCIFEPADGWLRFYHHSYIGAWFRKGLWWMVNWMWQATAGYNQSPNKAHLKPDLPAYWASDNIGVQNTADLWSVVSKATIARDQVVKIHDGLVVLSSGNKLKVDAIVACTGYDVSYPMFSQHDSIELGLPLPPGAENMEDTRLWEEKIAAADEKVLRRYPDLALQKNLPVVKPRNSPNHLYRGMVPVVGKLPTIAFLGQVGSTQAFTVSEIQSLWAVAYLMGKLQLPPTSIMEDDVALRIAWRRRRYLGDGHYIVYDQIAVGDKYIPPSVAPAMMTLLQYQSMLIRDLGLVDTRKGGGWKEVVQPYHPGDYRGLIQEWQASGGAPGVLGPRGPSGA